MSRPVEPGSLDRPDAVRSERRSRRNSHNRRMRENPGLRSWQCWTMLSFSVLFWFVDVELCWIVFFLFFYVELCWITFLCLLSVLYPVAERQWPNVKKMYSNRLFKEAESILRSNPKHIFDYFDALVQHENIDSLVVSHLPTDLHRSSLGPYALHPPLPLPPLHLRCRARPCHQPRCRRQRRCRRRPRPSSHSLAMERCERKLFPLSLLWPPTLAIAIRLYQAIICHNYYLKKFCRIRSGLQPHPYNDQQKHTKTCENTNMNYLHLFALGFYRC